MRRGRGSRKSSQGASNSNSFEQHATRFQIFRALQGLAPVRASHLLAPRGSTRTPAPRRSHSQRRRPAVANARTARPCPVPPRRARPPPRRGPPVTTSNRQERSLNHGQKSPIAWTYHRCTQAGRPLVTFRDERAIGRTQPSAERSRRGVGRLHVVRRARLTILEGLAVRELAVGGELDRGRAVLVVGGLVRRGARLRPFIVTGCQRCVAAFRAVERVRGLVPARCDNDS